MEPSENGPRDDIRVGRTLGQLPDAGVAPIQFSPLRTFNFFSVEYALINTPFDLVVHFYLTPTQWDVVERFFKSTGEEERELYPQYQAIERFWKEAFPQHLSQVATARFRVEYPRVAASYTEEVNSWWLKVTNIQGLCLFPSVLADDFFAALARSFETVSSK